MKKKIVRKSPMKVWIATFDPPGGDITTLVFSSSEKAYARAAAWAAAAWALSEVEGGTGEDPDEFFKLGNDGEFKRALVWYGKNRPYPETQITVTPYSVR